MKKTIFALAGLLVFCFALSSFAQVQNQDQGQQQASSQEGKGAWKTDVTPYFSPEQMITAESLRNQHIWVGGEDVGEVEEVIIDPKTGQITTVLMSYGGFLDLGEEFIAVPWKAFSFDSGLRGLQLEASEQQLQDAPRFEYGEIYERDAVTDVYEYWDYDLGW